MALARTPPNRRVFRDGWGDPDVLDWYSSIVRTRPEIPDINPIVEPPHTRNGLTEIDITFESPAPHLPVASRLARARLIAPNPEPDRICILMSAWNEHGYEARSRLAALLADDHIGTVVLENPFYGTRRSDSSDERPLATVADFAVMGRAAVIEGLTLLRHFAGNGHRMGVAGYSMGGNIAAFVATMSPEPVAVSAAAGSHSPAPPFMQGVMRSSIAFAALGGDQPEIVERLDEFFRSASVLDHEPPDHTRAAVLVAGTVDGFVPTSAVLALHRHWPGSKMEWVNAGHATLLWRNKDRMADGIVQAFDRLDVMAR